VAELFDQAGATGLSRPEGRLEVIDVAAAPIEPIGPSVSMIVLLSTMAGLLLAGLLAMASEYFSNTVRSSDDLAELTRSSVLGEINVNHGYRGSPVQPLVVEAKPESKTALAYRLLASRIPLGDAGAGRVRSILVVGSQAGEQVGELSANLAAVLARTGRSLTLVDADDVDANVSEMFVPGRATGLSEILALAPEAIGSGGAIDAIRVKRIPNIEVIPAGSTDPRTVREDTLALVLEKLVANSDLVLVSGAPFHRSAQSLLWARHTDGVIFAAQGDSTRLENVQYAVESLRLIGARILGSVLLVRKQSATDRWRHRVVTPEQTTDVAGLMSRLYPQAPPADTGPVGSSGGGQASIAPEPQAAGDKGAG
jgi:Mrp family chromosome partitioning ATPase